MPERSSTLGTWIKRFLMEYLPTERNLAINTRKSYRDGLTLLLPFVAERCGKAVERLAVEDLSADRVTAFLGHLEQERGCSVQTRNLRLTALRSFARYVAVRDAALVEWAGRIRAIPLKKTVRPRITWLPTENMDAMIAGPDRRAVAGRVEHALLLFLHNTGARASEAAGLQVEDLNLPERRAKTRVQRSMAREERSDHSPGTHGRKRACNDPWQGRKDPHHSALDEHRQGAHRSLQGPPARLRERLLEPASQTLHPAWNHRTRGACRSPCAGTQRATNHSACTATHLRLSPASLRRRYQHHS